MDASVLTTGQPQGFKAHPSNLRIVKKGQNKQDFPVVCGHVDIKSACRQVSKGNLAHSKRGDRGERGIKQESEFGNMIGES